jgi:hypothetical protein
MRLILGQSETAISDELFKTEHGVALLIEISKVQTIRRRIFGLSAQVKNNLRPRGSGSVALAGYRPNYVPL